MKKIIFYSMLIGFVQNLSAQSINLDKPTRVGNLIVFPDVQDDKMYYYMPDKARLATGPDGNPQFSFLRYVENKRTEEVTREGDGGGIVHAVVSMEVPLDDIKAAERDLKRIKSDAIIKGPIVYKSCRFSIVSSFKEEGGDFTKKVVGLGTGPVLDGGKAAISMRLTKLGSKILWESFKTATPDISFSFEVEIEGYRQPKRAIIEADFEQIYNNSHFNAALAVSFLQAEIDMAFEELTRSGAIKVEQFGADAGMETLLNTAYNKLTDMMFEPTGGTGTPNIADLSNLGAGGRPSMLDRASGMLERNQQREREQEKNRANNTNGGNNATGGNSSTTTPQRTTTPATVGTTAPPTASTTAPPTAGTTAPPTAGTTAPPTAGTTAPPTAGTTTPPTAGTTTPPTAGTTAPPTAGTTAPPTAGTTAPPTAGTTTPPTAGNTGSTTPATSGSGTPNAGGQPTATNNNQSNTGGSVGSSFSVAVSYQMKQKKQKGKFKIDLNKWTTDVLTNRFDQNIGNMTRLMNNPQFFREVNLDDPLFRQREVMAMLDGTNARDFGEFVNFVTVRMRKNHEGGAITDDELTINRLNFNQEGNSFKMLYGWKGDNDRDKWMEYQYEVMWSLFGDQTIKMPLAKSTFGAINLKAPLVRKAIEAQADPELLKTAGVRLITVNLYYKVGDKEFSRQMTLNPAKNILSQKADIFVPTEAVSYEYEVIWRLPNNKVVSLPRQSSGETILFVDEIPKN